MPSFGGGPSVEMIKRTKKVTTQKTLERNHKSRKLEPKSPQNKNPPKRKKKIWSKLKGQENRKQEKRSKVQENKSKNTPVTHVTASKLLFDQRIKHHKYQKILVYINVSPTVSVCF